MHPGAESHWKAVPCVFTRRKTALWQERRAQVEAEPVGRQETRREGLLRPAARPRGQLGGRAALS